MGLAASCYGGAKDDDAEEEKQEKEEEGPDPKPDPQPAEDQPSTSSSTNQAGPQSTAEHQPSTSRNEPQQTMTTQDPSSSSATGTFYRDHAGYRRDPANYGPVVFSHRQLETATDTFGLEFLVGEGGFGPVYRGVLETGQTVAIKQLDPHSKQGDAEFQTEVLMLSMAQHPNIINMIGYCAVGARTRLIVYEFMSLGSLESHLRNRVSTLDWNTRMRTAVGTAKALHFLHKTNPSVIYRDLKPSNILLGDGHYPKLSDLGLSIFGPSRDSTRSHISTDLMGTEGYCAPEYASTGHVSFLADIYSFGVVLLELITGQPSMDTEGVRSLVDWVRIRLTDGTEDNVADPWLRGDVPVNCVRKAVKLAADCVRENPQMRPTWTQVLDILENDLIISSPPPGERGSGGDGQREIEEEGGGPSNLVDRKGKGVLIQD